MFAPLFPVINWKLEAMAAPPERDGRHPLQDQNIKLDGAAIRVPARWSCRTGVCHTCETGLVVGTVSYRPDPIDAPADGNVPICCCLPLGDIVIDL